jgi:hypothetical protein
MDRLLQRGVKFHRSKLPDVSAETITIIAGNGAIEELEAVPGRRDFAEFTIGDTPATEEVFDWIVAEQRLVINEVKVEPQEGWLIKWRKKDENGDPTGPTFVYRVSRGNMPRCFDVLDQLGLTYRIHTNLVAIENG